MECNYIFPECQFFFPNCSVWRMKAAWTDRVPFLFPGHRAVYVGVHVPLGRENKRRHRHRGHRHHRKKKERDSEEGKEDGRESPTYGWAHFLTYNTQMSFCLQLLPNATLLFYISVWDVLCSFYSTELKHLNFNCVYPNTGRTGLGQ